MQAAKEAAEYEEGMLALNARVSTASEYAAWYRWCAPPHATSSSSSVGKMRKRKKQEAKDHDEYLIVESTLEFFFAWFYSGCTFTCVWWLLVNSQYFYAKVDLGS